MKKKILVIKLGALGDFIIALGAMAAIRKYHEDAHITLMTTNTFVPIGKDCKYFDEVITDLRPKWYQLKKWLTLRKTLISGNYDRVYDLQNNDRTSFYFKLFIGAKTPDWNGAVKGASHRNDDPSRVTGSAFDGHVQTLARAGISDIKIDDLKWMKEFTKIDKFKLPKNYVLFIAGCAPAHLEKRMPPENFGELANKLVKQGFTPVLVGTKDDATANAIIQKICPSVINLTGKTTLYDIPTIAHSAAGVIGNDTGPMHMSTVTGTPCIVIYNGVANIKKHAPLGENIKIIQKENISNISAQDILEIFEPKNII